MAINHYSNEKPRTFPVEGLSLMESPAAKGGVSGMEAARTSCPTMLQDADVKLLLWMDNRMGQRA
ncbi:hypothetical protein [Prevotella denticola]|uniref:hypothetical protein n=1 Tax=Prevotella denticola TaxID=28129 RepID=UPI001C60751B|nr:hypothetical protein [Prevotella denticola]